MRRSGLVLFALIASASPTLAQSASWSPWAGNGATRSRPAHQSQRRLKTVNGQYGVRTARPRSDDDDNDNDDNNDNGFASVFGGAPGGQIAYQKSTVQYPAVLQGGARPDIEPQAPPKVAFAAGFAPGSIVIDTSHRALYYVLGGGGAYRYPISVGRDGFRWKGTEKISHVASWPDWHPPVEMRARDPKLPEVMTGGIRNPLGAKALYLGNSLYRIHGTNNAKSIGYAASSGCFRMMNYHVLHLATLAGAGTTVHVLDHLPSGLATGRAAKSKRQG